MRRPLDFTDPERLRQQYGDSERFRVRVETHRRWSERKVDFFGWVLDQPT